jgi:hypothetical protein
MPSAIIFNGRRINRPGAYSKIDASELAGVAPAATGIVALVGTAEGGVPLTIDSTYSDMTTPEQGLARYRSGDLRTASQFCFQPSLDDAVPGGAQRIVAVKVNPATQSEVTLTDDDGNDSVDLTSVDYGLFTAQINVLIQPGTNQGKQITITLEDTVETLDDVGGDPKFSLLYTPGVEGYGTATATLTSTTLSVAGTKDMLGLDTDRAADLPSAGYTRAVSTDVGDVGPVVTIYGVNTLGAPISTTITLNGTTQAIAATTTFLSVHGVRLSEACTGDVTIDTPAGGVTTLFTIPAGTTSLGLVEATNMPVTGTFTVGLDAAAATTRVTVWGRTSAGAVIGSAFDVSAGTPVSSSGAFATIEYIALGDVPAARTATLTATIASTTHATYTTVQRVVDRLNQLDGFTATALDGDVTTFLMVDMDYIADESIHSGAYEFLADLNAFIEAINDSSALITAERATGASQVPADSVLGVTYLTGGIEGTATSGHWQQAFTLLKRRRVNTIVVLTQDAAVHALLATHLVWRAGRSEANGYVGIGTSDGEGETKSAIKTQIRALRTRHISAVSQEIQRFDPDTLEATWYPPYMLAAIAAGMQAGSAVGEPLTNKVPLVQDVRQDSSWSTEDDGEELIDAGLMFLEKKDVEGIRWVRSITTHLADDNPVFSEMSANAAANEAVFRLRAALQQRIGRRGLASSIGAIKGIAVDELNKLKDPVEGVIVNWRNLTIEQVGDVFPISVEIAPVQPINFIPVTVHLVAARAAA